MLQNTTMLNRTKNGEDLFIDYDDIPQIIIITCILSLFSVVGTTGNAFVLYVFSRKKDKNTSTIFILALAIIDFLTCLFVIPFTIVVEFKHKKIDNDIACKIYQFLITSNVPFSAFIMVAIAFDRYFCICRPWMKCLDVRCAKRIIFSLLLFVVSLGLITGLAHGVHQQRDINSSSERQTGNVSQGFNQSELVMNTTINDHNEKSGNIRKNISLVVYQIDELSHETEPFENRVNSTIFEFTGFCYPNEVILSSKFRKVYHKFYISLYLIAFITVFILYGLIYKSLLSRRSKRLRNSAAYRHQSCRRSTLLSSVFTRHSYCPEKSSGGQEHLNNQLPENKAEASKKTAAADLKVTDNLTVPANADEKTQIHNKNNTVEDQNSSKTNGELKCTSDTNLTTCSKTNNQKPVNHKNHSRKNKITNARFKDTNNENKHTCTVDHENANAKQSVSITIYRKDTRKSVREKHMIANIKTAGILFIVTVVFILAFLPSWLMATKIIPVNMIIFYMYFIYNVANPVIYAFFNHTFQKEVRHMLKCTP